MLRRFLHWTAILTLPRALMLAGLGLLVWSLVFVVMEPDGWSFILLMAPLVLGPALLAGVALWAVLAGLRRIFLKGRNS